MGNIRMLKHQQSLWCCCCCSRQIRNCLLFVHCTHCCCYNKSESRNLEREDLFLVTAEPSRAEPLDDAEWILDRFSSFKREGRIGVGYYRALVIYYLSMMCLEEDQPAVGNVKEGEKQQQQQQQRRHGRRGRRRCLFSSPPRRLLHPLYVID